MTSKEISTKVFELIGKDKINEAIYLLKKHINSNEKLASLIIQSARYSDVTKKIHMGVVEESLANIEKNKIRFALIDLVREIEEIVEEYPEINNEIASIKISQNHSGSGDNIAGDKITNNY